MNLPHTGSFAESFSTTLRAVDLADASSPSIVTLEARYDGAEPPVFSFRLGDIFESLAYDFGGRGEFLRRQWRVPPFVDPAAALTLSIAIPAGTSVTIRAFACASSAWRMSWSGGIRLNAHLGFWGFAPENTRSAVTYAAVCGYPACIVVPKVTKDGVFVCIHDDSVNRTGRDARGATAGDDHLFVRDLAYAQLLDWEFGSFKHPVWKGEKILLLSDFFDICAKTGMRPMFSTHPALTREQWSEVRAMLEARDLLSRFNVKSFDPEVLRLAHEVLGSDNEGYTLDVGSWNDNRDHAVEILDAIGFDKARSRVGIELYPEAMTPARCDAIRAAGYFAAVWGLSHAPAAVFRDFIRLGATEFTDDYNCSFGLDW